MKIIITMPVFNRKHFSIISYLSLLMTTKGKAEILIIDNNSVDGSVELLKQIGSLNIVKGDYGPIGGIRYVYDHIECDFIGKIDNDVMARPGWLEKSLQYLNEYDFVSLGYSIFRKPTMGFIGSPRGGQIIMKREFGANIPIRSTRFAPINFRGKGILLNGYFQDLSGLFPLQQEEYVRKNWTRPSWDANDRYYSSDI